MSETMKVRPGKAYFTHGQDEVIWLRDDDHIPHNKRPHEIENSTLMVEIRAPQNANWISFHVGENTTTENNGKTTTREKAIWFTISREQFDAIAAHINRK